MCIENGRMPEPSERTVVGYCFQRETQTYTREGVVQCVYKGVFKYTHEHEVGKKYKMEISPSGEPCEAGFHGFFSLESAQRLEEFFLESDDELTGSIVLMEAEFDEVFEIGTSSTFGLNVENEVPVFRSEFRQLNGVVKRYGPDDPAREYGKIMEEIRRNACVDVFAGSNE